MYPWVVFLHVFSAFVFALSHGASAAMAFRLRNETELERMRALLDASGTLWAAFALSFLGMLVTGIVAAFMGRWWSRGWIWLSLGILLGMSILKVILQRRHYNPLRRAAGLSFMEGNKDHPPIEPAPAEEIERLRVLAARPWLYTAISGGGFVLIVWLMMFKPF